jgi:hypothetical protein
MWINAVKIILLQYRRKKDYTIMIMWILGIFNEYVPTAGVICRRICWKIEHVHEWYKWNEPAAPYVKAPIRQSPDKTEGNHEWLSIVHNVAEIRTGNFSYRNPKYYRFMNVFGVDSNVNWKATKYFLI